MIIMRKLLLLSLILVNCSKDSYDYETEFNPGDEIIGKHAILDIPENNQYSEWESDYPITGEINFNSVNDLAGLNGLLNLNYTKPFEESDFPSDFDVTYSFKWSYEPSLSRWIAESYYYNMSARVSFYWAITFSNGLYTMKPFPDQPNSDKLILYFK